MTIEKLVEFAKTGQKDTDQLDLETGFIVNKKPARQWFNWLFNTLTKKINEIIDADFIPRNEIIDDLTTDDATKPVSAKQAKNLQDNKLDANKRGAASGVASLDENKKVPSSELPVASESISGITKVINSLTTGGVDQAFSAEMGKKLFNMFSSVHGDFGRQYIPNPENPDRPLIFQWGEAIVGSGISAPIHYVSFPIAFPNRAFGVFGAKTFGVGNGWISQTYESLNKQGFIYRAEGPSDTSFTIKYFAIGD